jgi:D-serine deaminase-like pyridoxal phosphate-dependent protein
MDTPQGLGQICSPALLFDADQIATNLRAMLAVVGGDPERLRPHLKTHKCAEILRLQLDIGIRQVKCATLAEAEMAALAGVPDVLIAYPLVGPHPARLMAIRERFPETVFSTVVDSDDGLRALDQAQPGHLESLGVFLDFDCGMHRTGIGAGPAAIGLVMALLGSERLHFAGIHAYDGHIHASDPAERSLQFEEAFREVDSFCKLLNERAIAIPLVVAGGSPTFRLCAEHARKQTIPWQCSPGTPVLWDFGYASNYADLPFAPAAFLLTRVISRPRAGHICLDLGHKAVAAENPLERRLYLPALPAARFISQSEEHLVVNTPEADSIPIGAALLAVPQHICPTVALHDRAQIIRGGRLTGEIWSISARTRLV